MEVAVRALVVSCAATAAIAPNASPTLAHARPNANDPSAGSPVADSATPVSRASTRFPAPTTISADANGAPRPIAVAPIISVRPASSSPRVRRTTRTTANNATNTAPKLPILIMAIAPTEEGS
jgi:hypothetical protein